MFLLSGNTHQSAKGWQETNSVTYSQMVPKKSYTYKVKESDKAMWQEDKFLKFVGGYAEVLCTIPAMLL